MNSVESTPSLEQVSKALDEKVKKLLEGPPSDNYMLRQVQLAVEKFVSENPDHVLDHDTVEKIGVEWANSPWSKKFDAIWKHPNFKDENGRFKENVANITLNDLLLPLNQVFGNVDISQN